LKSLPVELKTIIVGGPKNLCHSVSTIPARKPDIDPIQAANLLVKTSAVECPIEVRAGLCARNELILEGDNIGCGIYKGMGLARSKGQKRNGHRCLICS
jgi:hypothetical protein